MLKVRAEKGGCYLFLFNSVLLGLLLSDSRRELKGTVPWQQRSFLTELAFIVLAKFKIHKDDEPVSQPWKLSLFVDPDN